MSGTTDNQGPALSESVQEIQATFPNDATLQAALGQLGLAGYDRSDFSLPEDQADSTSQTPNEDAENPTDDTDKRQLRTMGSGIAGATAAFALAGATIATGGAAGVAALGAAAVGAGAMAAATTSGVAADRVDVAKRDQRGAEGRLVLAIRTRDENQAKQVMEIVQGAGATDARPVMRSSEAEPPEGVLHRRIVREARLDLLHGLP